MPKGYKQLSYDKCVVISHMLRQGHSQAEIARQLKRSEGTISREIKHNRIKSSGNYYPIIANRKMLNRWAASPFSWKNLFVLSSLFK